MESKTYWRVKEFSDYFGIGENTARIWLARGDVAFIRLSKRCVRIPDSEVQRLVADGLVPARGKGQRTQ